MTYWTENRGRMPASPPGNIPADLRGFAQRDVDAVGYRGRREDEARVLAAAQRAIKRLASVVESLRKNGVTVEQGHIDEVRAEIEQSVAAYYDRAGMASRAIEHGLTALRRANRGTGEMGTLCLMLIRLGVADPIGAAGIES